MKVQLRKGYTKEDLDKVFANEEYRKLTKTHNVFGSCAIGFILQEYYDEIINLFIDSKPFLSGIYDDYTIGIIPSLPANHEYIYFVDADTKMEDVVNNI